MSHKASEQMMGLLQELAALKEIDSASRPRTREEKAARRERQRHRAELREQIKQVARTNNKPSEAAPRSGKTTEICDSARD